MIVRMAEVYKEVSEEMGLSKAVVESIGVEVLATLREKLNAPTDIAYELPKLGTFAMHLSKYTSFHNYLLKSLANGTYVLGENYDADMYEKNLIIMNKINNFYAEKQRVKDLKDERKTREPSQSQPEEHI